VSKSVKVILGLIYVIAIVIGLNQSYIGLLGATLLYVGLAMIGIVYLVIESNFRRRLKYLREALNIRVTYEEDNNFAYSFANIKSNREEILKLIQDEFSELSSRRINYFVEYLENESLKKRS